MIERGFFIPKAWVGPRLDQVRDWGAEGPLSSGLRSGFGVFFRYFFQLIRGNVFITSTVILAGGLLVTSRFGRRFFLVEAGMDVVCFFHLRRGLMGKLQVFYSRLEV